MGCLLMIDGVRHSDFVQENKNVFTSTKLPIVRISFRKSV